MISFIRIIRILFIAASKNSLSAINPPTTKLFRPTFTAKRGCCNPWISDFPTEIVCEIIRGYVFWVMESNGDS